MAQYPLNNNTNLSVFPIQTDIISSAITTTTNTSIVTPTIGTSFVSSIIVTAVTGTLPTMNINIEQSIDGITWSVLYTYPTIVTTGTFNSPQLPVNLAFIRYSQVLGGTTPSFTRSIVRNQINANAGNLDLLGNLKTRSSLAETIYTQSTNNNTSTQLAGGATFTGVIESALSYPNAIISIRCDQAYTITIDQFSDLLGTIQYSPSIIYTRSAGVAFNQSINVAGSFIRLKITNNGGVATTNLFAETFFGILPNIPNVDNNGNLPTSSSVAADATPSNINITTSDIVSTNTVGQNGQIFYSGSPTPNSFANYALSSNEGVSVQTSGTWVGTLQSELSTDGGTTYIPVTMSQTGLHTYVTSFTGNVNAKVNTAGATNFRIRSTLFSSGTCTVKVIQTANIGTTQLSTAVNVSNPVFFIDRSGTITTGGVAQVLSPANSSRGVLKVMNTSNAVLYINELGTATLSAPSYVIMPNQEFSFSDGMPLSAVSIIGATTGQSFTAREANGSPNINTNVLGGIVPVGQTASATALSVVPSTDIYTPTPILYTVTTAGTGYVIGDLLQQSFNQTSAGVLTDKWINVTQKTVLTTTPSIANIASNLKLATELNGSTFTNSVQTKWFANVAGTGYSIGDILQQTIKNNNNVVSVTWFNLTLSTLLTTAPVIANLNVYIPSNQSSFRNKKKWFIAMGGNTASQSTTIFLIKNTNAFPIKLENLTISAVSNVWATANSSEILGLQAQLFTGTVTSVGGSVANATLLNGLTYSTDSTVTLTYNYTSVTGGVQLNLGDWCQISMNVGGTASNGEKSGHPYSPEFLKGLIIPAGATLAIRDNTGFGSQSATPRITINGTLTEEL
jgi:hypothetical protein